MHFPAYLLTYFMAQQPLNSFHLPLMRDCISNLQSYLLNIYNFNFKMNFPAKFPVCRVVHLTLFIIIWNRCQACYMDTQQWPLCDEVDEAGQEEILVSRPQTNLCTHLLNIVGDFQVLYNGIYTEKMVLVYACNVFSLT